jgi:glycosyltransferase involved in cell wall biosynthesis
MALVSIIVPAYNEEGCVDELARRLQAMFELETVYEFEVIFVENGSEDSTLERLERIREGDARFKILKLSRNFGAEGGITAGMTFSRGEACAILMADLQEPPELLRDMLRKWEEGYENIYGVVTKRRGTSWLRDLNSRIFYSLAAKLSGQRLPRGASDFRLVDRKVADAVLSLNERNRFLRGLFAWVGFKSFGVAFERQERFDGESKARTSVVLNLAIRGILLHSLAPLRAITALGVLASMGGFAVLGWLTFLFLTQGVPFDGFGTIVGLNLLGFSFLALFLGVIGEYLGMTFEEAKSRPAFIVSERFGITED